MIKKRIDLTKSRLKLISSLPNGSVFGNYDWDQYWILDNKILLYTESSSNIKNKFFFILKEDNHTYSHTYQSHNGIYLPPNYINKKINEGLDKFTIDKYNLLVNIVDDFPIEIKDKYNSEIRGSKISSLS